MLDVKSSASTSSDIRNAVDLKLTRIRDELYDLKTPSSLLVTSDAIDITEDTVYLQIDGVDDPPEHPSFELTNYRKTFTLLLSNDAGVNYEDQEPVEYETWIRLQSSALGNQRPKRSFTIDTANNFIYLKDYPSSGTTWKAKLAYYKTPATIVDGGVPEIGLQHERLIVLAVVTDFPNMFTSEERLSLLASYSKKYDEALKKYLRDNFTGKKSSRMRPAMRRRSERSTFWGTGETS